VALSVDPDGPGVSSIASRVAVSASICEGCFEGALPGADRPTTGSLPTVLALMLVRGVGVVAGLTSAVFTVPGAWEGAAAVPRGPGIETLVPEGSAEGVEGSSTAWAASVLAEASASAIAAEA